MIIRISPPSTVSLRNIEKKTKNFFCNDYSIKKNKCGLLVSNMKFMILVKKREILLSFNSDDVDTIKILQNFLMYVFTDVIVGADFKNPITDNLNFVFNFPKGVVS